MRVSSLTPRAVPVPRRTLHPRSWAWARGVRPLLLGMALVVAACGGGPDESAATIQFQIPRGANFGEVVDTLTARGVVTRPGLFGLYARLRGADAEIRAGSYQLREGERWSDVVATLTEGRVLTIPVTFPEGWRLAQIAPKIAGFSGVSVDSVEALLLADSAHLPWGVPGPGLARAPRPRAISRGRCIGRPGRSRFRL